MNEFATAGLRADLTILLDLSVEESERRREHRDADRFEREARDFHQRVRESYLQVAKGESQNWLVLDASQPIEASLDKLLSELRRRKWLS